MSGSLINRINCYLTGHDYAVRSDGDRIYLCCEQCGLRSSGWSLFNEREQMPRPRVHSHAGAAGKAPHSSRGATA